MRRTQPRFRAGADGRDHAGAGRPAAARRAGPASPRCRPPATACAAARCRRCRWCSSATASCTASAATRWPTWRALDLLTFQRGSQPHVALLDLFRDAGQPRAARARDLVDLGDGAAGGGRLRRRDAAAAPWCERAGASACRCAAALRGDAAAAAGPRELPRRSRPRRCVEAALGSAVVHASHGPQVIEKIDELSKKICVGVRQGGSHNPPHHLTDAFDVDAASPFPHRPTPQQRARRAPRRPQRRAAHRTPAAWPSAHVQGNVVILPQVACRATSCATASAIRSPVRCWRCRSPAIRCLPTLGADIDIRTDVPRYRVWRDGELVDEPTDMRALWRDDLVTFVIGCSFSFEQALLDEGMRAAPRRRRTATSRCTAPTSPPCRPAPFRGPMVVSMRPLRAADAIRAIQITSRFPAVHGAPVHLGDPALIGIARPRAARLRRRRST